MPCPMPLMWCHCNNLAGCTWTTTLRWHHNNHAGVSNHQPRGCLLNRLFTRRSKKTSKLRVTGLCVGNSPGPVNSPHKEPVTRKMFPFDDVIMKKEAPMASGLLFTKWMDVLSIPQDLVNFRSQEIGCDNDCITQKFDRHLSSTAAEVPVKFQSNWRNLNLNLMALRLLKILW